MRERADPLVRALLSVTAGLLAMRLYAARTVGFGDSEALYASYALHPQPMYLDHPGLVGTVAGLLGGGGAPPPSRAHAATLVVATVLPWMAFAVTKLAGASVRAAAVAGLVLAVTPELGVGLFALSPDTLLAPLWLGALGAAIFAARQKPGEPTASVLWLASGLLAGTCGAAKISGLLLPLSFACALGTRALRSHARSIWPWVGLALGAVVLVPVLDYERRTGFAMLRHRFVETQAGAGPSLRNVGALLGGQLAYISPVLAGIALFVVRDLWRRWREDATSTLLFFASAVPAVALLPLMLWSRVAEPHWLAPALLGLPLAGAISPPRLPRFLLPAGMALALVMTVTVHVWVLVPDSMRFARPADPKLDIANELYGWDEAERAVRELLASEPKSAQVTVIGPHWIVCAQLHARLGAAVPVGCNTPIRDDFDAWYPRDQWKRAEKLLYVTDDRFPTDVTKLFSDRTPSRRARASVFRGGRRVRTFELTLFEGGAHAVR